MTSISALCPSLPKPAAINHLRKQVPYLIPAIAGVALSALYFPGVSIGVLVGCVNLLPHLMTKDTLSNEDKKEYAKEFQGSNLLYITSIGPLWKECAFRGGIQPTLQQGLISILPITATLLTPTITLAAAVAILATTAFAEWRCTYSSSERKILDRVKFCARGIQLGVLATTLGLPVAIAAEVTHKTLVATEWILNPKQPKN